MVTKKKQLPFYIAHNKTRGAKLKAQLKQLGLGAGRLDLDSVSVQERIDRYLTMKPRRLVCQNAHSNKFWQFTPLPDGSYYIEYGAIGATPNFGGVLHTQELEKKLREKMRKGYVHADLF